MASGLEKNVLITGGSGGLGHALAAAFAAQGCRVAISARNRKSLQKAADELSRNGAQVRAIACDVTQRGEVKDLADQISHHWGAVQILINNAGIARAASFAVMPDGLWDDT